MSTNENASKRLWRGKTLVALFAIYGACVSADPTVVVPPLPLPGPYPVGCSNMSQDFTRMPPGENAQDYWEGNPRSDGSPRYITDLLVDPADTLDLTLNAPSELYSVRFICRKRRAVRDHCVLSHDRRQPARELFAA